ncbi:MAG: bifunctional glycosyltransferase/class I SAM-dependent methyltransferase [Deltaproteobacteria bacterium]|nr:bifunctional glycosyltransferase/class I SAM-dependent methyltransferase [Deltaproteobacteria bacterium]
MAPPRPKTTSPAVPSSLTQTTLPRVMVHIVAYNAASTLSKVLDRIPHDLRHRLTEICVFDDASSDDTFLVGQGYKATRDMPMLKVFRNSHNQGYGGNQKLGYQYAIDNNFDFVVLLHGDGQYAPEAMDLLLQPLINGEAEAVFGSRMLEEGAARQGGMPLYKYVGNKILTKAQNALLEMNLSEFHSGYRAYSVAALKKLPIQKNSNDFHFDTQIIIQLKAANMRIKEVAIPTYYGDEICHVNGMKYARDVMKSVMEYRAHRAGLVRRPEYEHAPVPAYTEKHSTYSSHRRLVDAVPAGSKVLDVGCADGHLARALVAKGCEVVGVDVHHSDAAAQACTRFYVADLESDAWAPQEHDFDVILYADVLEHLRNTNILNRSRQWLRFGGRIIASTGNIALWFMRLSLLTGKFRYAPRGILDETHVKLYTRQTFRELIEHAGLKVMHEDWTVIPLEKLAESLPALQKATLLLDSVQYQIARRWPGLFAYQVILQAEPA